MQIHPSERSLASFKKREFQNGLSNPSDKWLMGIKDWEVFPWECWIDNMACGGIRSSVNFAFKSMESKVHRNLSYCFLLCEFIKQLYKWKVFPCLTVIIATASVKTRRQKDQVKGREMHGLLPEKDMKVASLSQSYSMVWKSSCCTRKAILFWTVIQS